MRYFRIHEFSNLITISIDFFLLLITHFNISINDIDGTFTNRKEKEHLGGSITCIYNIIKGKKNHLYHFIIISVVCHFFHFFSIIVTFFLTSLPLFTLVCDFFSLVCWPVETGEARGLHLPPPLPSPDFCQLLFLMN